jgi:lipopolysaccharide export system permease protein
MKILKFYVLREFIPPYVGGMAFLSTILLLERVMSFVKLVAKGYADIFDLLTLVFFSIPPTLALTMPMSTLIGALVAVSRLSHDSEITAMRASGIRLGSIFLSLYLAGFAIGGLSFWITDRIVPIGNIKFRTLYQELTIARPDVGIDSLSINEVHRGVTLVVDRVDEKTGDLLNVTIFKAEEGERVRTISAKRGWFVQSGAGGSHISIRLKDGALYDQEDLEEGYFGSTVFGTLDLNIPVKNRELQQMVKSPRDMSMEELAKSMAGLEIGAKSYNIHVMEQHKRIAIPFACILFVFLGTPFAVTKGRSGKGLGLGIGVVIIFMYYILLLALEPVGRAGVIQPALAMWLPNILFIIVGVFNIVRKGRV